MIQLCRQLAYIVFDDIIGLDLGGRQYFFNTLGYLLGKLARISISRAVEDRNLRNIVGLYIAPLGVFSSA